MSKVSVTNPLIQPEPEFTHLSEITRRTYFFAKLVDEQIDGLSYYGYRLWLKSNTVFIDIQTSSEWSMLNNSRDNLQFLFYQPVDVQINTKPIKPFAQNLPNIKTLPQTAYGPSFHW